MAHISKLGSGNSARWKVRWRQANGVDLARTFARKIDAQRHADSVEVAKTRGSYVDPAQGRIRFGSWADKWESKPHATRASTHARDLSYLRSLVRPHFEDYTLAAITRGIVQDWVWALSSGVLGVRGKPLAPATVTKAAQILAKILDAAVLDGRLAANPARGIELPRTPDREARFLSPGELLSLEAAMPAQWSVLVPFLADTGLRIGEAAGLRWRDVDTLNCVVSVRQVLVEVHGEAIFGEPKTAAGFRKVPTLTHETGARLDIIRSRSTDFVFASGAGGPLRPASFRSRVWNPAVAAAGLPEPLPTPHTLRHTAIAHWIAAGVDPFRLAKWAGHRSVATIYRVYGHLLDLDADDERAALSAIRASAIAAHGEPARVITFESRR